MFSIGFYELLLVLIVGIVVINPKDLPRMGYQLGVMLAQIRKLANDAKRALDPTIDESA